jgi:hypothetical protein
MTLIMYILINKKEKYHYFNINYDRETNILYYNNVLKRNGIFFPLIFIK